MKRSAAVAALGALAQDTRLDIFRMLIGRAPDGVPAGEVGARLGLAPPTLSFHLNQLRFAGLVSSRRHGRSILYSADIGAMNGLMAYLNDHCCGGRPELCAPAPCAAAANDSSPIRRIKRRSQRTSRARSGAVKNG